MKTEQETSREKTMEASKALVSKFLTDVWNYPSRMETIDELLSDDFTITTDGKSIVGKENFKKWITGYQSMVGDYKLFPQEMMVTDDGSRVITRVFSTGYNKGMFGTEPDKNQSIELSAITIMEVKNGKLTHNWVERSALELFERLTKKRTRSNTFQ